MLVLTVFRIVILIFNGFCIPKVLLPMTKHKNCSTKVNLVKASDKPDTHKHIYIYLSNRNK